MSTVVSLPPGFDETWNLADLKSHLGDIPLERIRMFPYPGTATEQDLVDIEARENRLYELEDGVLVEKTMGCHESLLALLMGTELMLFLRQHDGGQAFTTDAPFRILPGTVKMPDVCFVSWERLFRQTSKRTPIYSVVPDFVVEILSPSNTKREMANKLEMYFRAGVRLVWYIDPKRRCADCFRSVTDVVHLDETGEIDGGEVLPGFKISLHTLFAEADRQGPSE